MRIPARKNQDQVSAFARSVQRTAANLFAALESGLEAVPFIVVAGLVAFAPIGDTMAGIGVTAAFLGAIVASLIAATMAGRRGLVVGPSAGLALMIAGTLQVLRSQGLLGADVGDAMAIAIALTVGSGVLMTGISVLGIARITPLVPYPVLAGLRNGTAVLLLFEQMRPALGMQEHGAGGPHLGATIVAAVTIIAMLVEIPRLRFIPSIITALLAGTLAHHALALFPTVASLVGPTMDQAAHGTVQLPALSARFSALTGLPFHVLTEVLLPTILSMTVFALLETVASASAMQGETGERRNSSADLLAVALSNVAGGMGGALPVAGSLEETVPEAKLTTKRSRLASLLRGGFLLALALLAMPILGFLPDAVLAGLIIAAALKLVDLSSIRQIAASARRHRRHRVEGIGSLLVVIIVAGIAAVLGLSIAVIVGVMLSLVVFVVDMARGPVRRRYDSPLGRSRARRGDQETHILMRDGGAIEVIELHGALFFGSIDQVAAAIEAARGAGGRYIVLDIHRIHRMDLSAARGLLGACERVWRTGDWLALAGMRPGVPAWDYLSDRGLHTKPPPGRSFPTIEDALEAAETSLLADRLGTVAKPSLSGEQALASLGVPPTAINDLLYRMVETGFAPGDPICRVGDATRDLFILLQGHVDVILPVNGTAATRAHATRLATLAPGTLFGEMALLSNAPRSADLIAHGAVRCLRLGPDGLAVLRVESPDSAWFLLKAIALQIELNLRLANAAIASYEE